MGQDEDTGMEGLDPGLPNFTEDPTLLETVKSLILGHHPQSSSLSRREVASGKPCFLANTQVILIDHSGP